MATGASAIGATLYDYVRDCNNGYFVFPHESDGKGGHYIGSRQKVKEGAITHPHIHYGSTFAGFPGGRDGHIVSKTADVDAKLAEWEAACDGFSESPDCHEVMRCIRRRVGGDTVENARKAGTAMKRYVETKAATAGSKEGEGASKKAGKGANAAKAAAAAAAKPTNAKSKGGEGTSRTSGKGVRGGPCPTCGGGGGGGAKPCTCKPGGEAETKKPVNSKPKEGEGTSKTPGKGPIPGKSVRGESCRTCGGGGGGGAPDCTCTKSNKPSTVAAAAAAAPAPLLTKRLDLSIKSKRGDLAYELPKGAYEGVTTTHDPAMLVVPTANTLQREKNAPGVLIQEPTKEFVFRKKEGKLVITEKGTKGEVTWELLERTKKRKSRRRGTRKGTRKGTRRGTRRSQGTRKGTRRATRNRINRTNTRKRV
jgi:hypothetical protein